MQKVIYIENVNTNTPSVSSTQAILSQHKLQRSENYFYQRATEEVKKFSKPSKYEKISSEKDKILYYMGRIFPDKFSQISRISDIQIIQQTSCLTYPQHHSLFQLYIHKNSPIAYSIISGIHWYHKVAKNSGVETLMHYVLQKVCVIEG